MSETEEIEEFQLSELAEKAQDRRERLKALRTNRTLGNNVGESGEGGPLGIVPRSYQPVNAGVANVDEDVKEIMKKTSDIVERITEESKDITLGDNLDVSIIAPRKVDWDLRRGIQDQLDKLERRTNNAIVTLLRDSHADSKSQS